MVYLDKASLLFSLVKGNISVKKITNINKQINAGKFTFLPFVQVLSPVSKPSWLAAIKQLKQNTLHIQNSL
jgi:hypothetical protein